MEELRSTEILDKEIQDDARKKAEKILIESKEKAQQIIASVDDQISKTRDEKQVFYDEQKKRFEKDVESALPLEKQRYLVSFEDKAVTEAIYSYLSSLNDESKSILYTAKIKQYQNFLVNNKVDVSYSGMDEAKVISLLSSIMEKKDINSCKKINDNINDERIIIETIDGKVKCRISVSELITEIKDNYSMELTKTLFCGRLPE